MKEESEFRDIEKIIIIIKSVAFIVDDVKLHNTTFQPPPTEPESGRLGHPALDPSLPHQAPHNEGRAAPRGDIEKYFKS